MHKKNNMVKNYIIFIQNQETEPSCDFSNIGKLLQGDRFDLAGTIISRELALFFFFFLPFFSSGAYHE